MLESLGWFGCVMTHLLWLVCFSFSVNGVWWDGSWQPVLPLRPDKDDSRRAGESPHPASIMPLTTRHTLGGA